MSGTTRAFDPCHAAPSRMPVAQSRGQQVQGGLDDLTQLRVDNPPMRGAAEIEVSHHHPTATALDGLSDVQPPEALDVGADHVEGPHGFNH